MSYLERTHQNRFSRDATQFSGQIPALVTDSHPIQEVNTNILLIMHIKDEHNVSSGHFFFVWGHMVVRFRF